MALLWNFFIVFLIVGISADNVNKGLNIALKSKWPASSLESEASEFFSNYNFWEFFETLGVLEGEDKARYDKVMEVAESLMSHGKLSLLKYTLAIHNENPKLEVYRQLQMKALHHLNDEQKKQVNDPSCQAWVYFQNKVSCDPNNLNEILKSTSNENEELTRIYKFDHVHPSSSKDSPYIFLFGQVGDVDTMKFHKNILKALENKQFGYVFRHYVTKEYPKLNLQGFGVDLALKSLEYKVIDDTKHEGEEKSDETVSSEADEVPISGFDFKVLTKSHPHLSSELLSFKAHLLSEGLELEKLKVWELKDLGIQSAQKILTSPDPLRMMKDISQNLPTLAHSLARQQSNSTVRTDILNTIDSLTSQENMLWVNQNAIDPALVDIYSLYDLLSKQLSNYDTLKNLRIQGDDIYSLLNLPKMESLPIQVNLNTDLADFINDLQRDPRYIQWFQSLSDILRPVWPGQFHYIAKNLFNVIVFIDPASPQSMHFAHKISSLVWQNLPARVGFLFDLKNEESEFAYKLWKSARDTNLHQWFNLVTTLAKLDDQQININTLKKEASQLGIKDVDKMEKSDKWDSYIAKMKEFSEKKGLSGLSNMVFINGYLLKGKDADEAAESIFSKYFELRSEVQQKVKNGELNDNINFYEHFLNTPSCLPSFNRLVLPTTSEGPKFIPLHESTAEKALENMKYIRSSEDYTTPITHLLAVDLSTKQGKQLVSSIIHLLKKDEDPEGINKNDIRAAIISHHNSNEGDILFRAIYSVMSIQTKPQFYLDTLDKIINSDEISFSQVYNIIKENSKINSDKWKELFDDRQFWNKIFKAHNTFCTENVELAEGQNAIITNGRLLLIPAESNFSIEDYELLSTFELNSRAKTIVDAVANINYDVDDPDQVTSSFVSDIIMKLNALLNSNPDRTSSTLTPPTGEPSFVVKNSENPDIKIVALLDPLSQDTQKLTPVLMVLAKLFAVELKVYLNPSKSLSDLPLKNYYRYALDNLAFDNQGRALPGGIASFSNLPQSRLLSTKLDTPSSWLVLSSKCRYDLDNIVLQDLPESEQQINAEFTLEHILVEGSCLDLSNKGIPPRGLELMLGDSINPHQQDSLVMSNLGYFQLKAQPGIWTLQIANETKSQLMYRIKDNKSHEIILQDFNGKKELLFVEKNPGFESASLWGDIDASKTEGIWTKFTSYFNKEKDEKDDETLHIFSLASGHLYERFLKVMMLSVIKNTKTPVKFWFLSNFLSPAFKEFVPKMAQHYNFSVELVTYKWPTWLHQQKEKQRIIWGYKILFLDVLFPLNVKKIIYVDSDQVARTDLKELLDFDLQGAPYAYTPFCAGDTMNKDTTGFRFWDSGYWRDHLGNLPYHISALYVVDLQTIRRKGYADQLRVTYDSLSKDPNSLANLDQDLPNYLQHVVPIRSLPQEWLWCETWCTQESKEKAKTIDLCNNPLTKVPKLEAAVKNVPEWTGYDEEIKQLEHKLNNPPNKKDKEAQKVKDKDEL